MTDKTEALKLAREAILQIAGALPFPVGQRALAAIDTALAEQPAQQQEPVAKVDYKQRDGFRWLNSFGWQRIPDGASLYTSPPASKPWVGLTDEEIEKLAVENGHATFLNDDEETGIIWFDGDATPFARAIEQKLREKNGG